MKRLNILAGSLAMALAFQAAPAADIQAVDSIVAVVDNAVITRQDLQQVQAHLRQQQPQAAEAELQQRALLQLINQSLMAQAAERAGLRVSDAEIDNEVARLAQAQKLTPAQFYQRLAREGASRNTLRRTLGQNLLADKMRQNVLMEQARVSEEEIDAALMRAQQQGRPLPQGAPSPQYRVQHILIKDGSEVGRKLAGQIQAQARSGGDFAQLARQYSQDGSAQQGGDLGWIDEGQTVASFEAAVKALQPGQISQPVRSQFGWHIIRLAEVRSGDSAQERVRNGMRQALREEKTALAMQEMLRQLHEQAFIQVR